MTERMLLRAKPAVVKASSPPPLPVTPPIAGADPVSLAVAGLPALGNALAAKCAGSVASAGSLGGKSASTHTFLTATDTVLADKVQAVAPKDNIGIMSNGPEIIST